MNFNGCSTRLTKETQLLWLHAERFASLDLVPRLREGFGNPASGGAFKTMRRFLDFVINGVSLFDTIGSQRDRIEHDDARIVWREIGYENSYDPRVDLDSFTTVGPFAFAPDVYSKKLQRLLRK
jgi:hypothetical protein